MTEHEHRFEIVNPFQPEYKRCECGETQYKYMGPIHRYRVMLDIAEEQYRLRLRGRGRIG